MKRTTVSLEHVASLDNLVLATWKAARGKRARPDVQAFLEYMDNRLELLAAGIRAGTVPTGVFREFVIQDPKVRRIHAACFEDRVLHHALFNFIEPVFERTLTDSSYACRPGRGSHAAVLRVQHHLRRHPWYGQVDVAGYFPAISHDVLKALLASRFKGRDLLDLFSRIIDSYQASPGHGLPIGALTSQHFANFYLDAADRRLQANPAVRVSVRYMDDIVWWCDHRSDVRAVRDDRASYLEIERGLRLKPDAVINRSGHGITFCGYRVRRGMLRLTRQKQRRYGAMCTARESAWACASLSDVALQRAYAAVLAPTLLANAVAWRRQNLRLPLCPYDDAQG